MREPATVATLAELARRLGVHERTVRRWHGSGAMPIERTGRYHVARVAAWRSESTSRNRERSGSAAQGIEVRDVGELPPPKRRRDELREARVDELRLKIREREIELEARQAQLIPRGDVARLLRDRGTFFRRHLVALARNLAQPLAAEAEPIRVQQLLEDALLRVLEEAYSHVPAEYRD
jgi:excisionase family DNA binding protein